MLTIKLMDDKGEVFAEHADVPMDRLEETIADAMGSHERAYVGFFKIHKDGSVKGMKIDIRNDENDIYKKVAVMLSMTLASML
jgi:hypothetical protein